MRSLGRPLRKTISADCCAACGWISNTDEDQEPADPALSRAAAQPAPAAESSPGDGEHLDQVHIVGRCPEWRRIWPTPPADPGHDAFDTWMTAHGPVIIGTRPG